MTAIWIAAVLLLVFCLALPTVDWLREQAPQGRVAADVQQPDLTGSGGTDPPLVVYLRDAVDRPFDPPIEYLDLARRLWVARETLRACKRDRLTASASLALAQRGYEEAAEADAKADRESQTAKEQFWDYLFRE